MNNSSNLLKVPMKPGCFCLPLLRQSKPAQKTAPPTSSSSQELKQQNR